MAGQEEIRRKELKENWSYQLDKGKSKSHLYMVKVP